jgi:UDP-2,4-diacetamido-2,4,6-trideoxy-beta-L-altropyranose hydrolase
MNPAGHSQVRDSGSRSPSSKNLIIRTDAGIAIGTGHAMRCLALAQAWQDAGAGGGAAFAMAESTPAIRSRLSSEGCKVLNISSRSGSPDDAKQTTAYARELQAEWIAVDGYQLDAAYQRALKSEGFKLLFLDDYGHATHYSADIVLNQNVCADEALYASREPHTQLFLGPRYCLLRREFAAWRDWKREVSEAGHRVLVTMGGSDPENLTPRVVDAIALTNSENLEVTVVIGGSVPQSNLEHMAGQPGVSPEVDGGAKRGMTVRVLRDVANIAEWMAWADVAISSAGTTCWELCSLGLPALLIDVAKNQTALAQQLQRRECAIHLGEAHAFNAEKVAHHLGMLLKSVENRRVMSQHCREIVDGKGVLRVVSAMKAGLRLRPARPADSRILWEWANDTQVRGNAFSSAPILWEQHEIWFAGKMKDSACLMLVAENGDGRPVGQFRVDWRSEQEGEIDVSLAPEWRGKGYGSVLIDFAVNRVFAGRGRRLHALVKLGNQPSRHAFEQAGFTSIGEEWDQRQQVIHYVRVRER